MIDEIINKSYKESKLSTPGVYINKEKRQFCRGAEKKKKTNNMVVNEM